MRTSAPAGTAPGRIRALADKRKAPERMVCARGLVELPYAVMRRALASPRRYFTSAKSGLPSHYFWIMRTLTRRAPNRASDRV